MARGPMARGPMARGRSTAMGRQPSTAAARSPPPRWQERASSSLCGPRATLGVPRITRPGCGHYRLISCGAPGR